MRTTGVNEAKASRNSRNKLRAGMIAAALGAAILIAPAAHANDGDGGDGDHHHHGFFLGDITPTSPERGGCGEDGLQTLGLDPIASEVIHTDVEPIAYGLDNGFGLPGESGLGAGVHALNCGQVVPWENEIDYQRTQWQDALAGLGIDISGLGVPVECTNPFGCKFLPFLP